MLVTLKQSTVFGYSILNSDFINLLFKHLYLKLPIDAILAPGRFEIRRFCRIMKKRHRPLHNPVRGSSMNVPQAT